MVVNRTLFLWMVVLLLGVGSVLSARTWTHQDGRTFEGDMIDVDGDVLTIRRDSDQREFEIDLAVLSEGDQAYVSIARILGPLMSFDLGWLVFVFVLVVFIPLELAVVHYVGKLFRLESWTFGRSVAWQLYYLVVVLVGYAITFGVMLIYASIVQVTEGAYEAVEPSVISPAMSGVGLIVFFLNLYLNSLFLKTGMFRTFLFILCCSAFFWVAMIATAVLFILLFELMGGLSGVV